MRRLIAFILLSAAFLGGYQLGRKPGSPDIFAWAGMVYHRLTVATSDISARAKDEDVTLTEAALSSLLDRNGQSNRPDGRNPLDSNGRNR